ncbi:glyoxalase [Williamsia sp. 1138]|uniref:VOC family protein n=1 Tax=Williamsia sp. 1138 TaxID=1903117 RepID=UPI000A0F55F4|nr:VOC family protein [Williamsia sp. 1138]OZG27998.1 glyoxalase [Williamsia sp. 1138]
MNWTLELVILPVTDVDRARDFYKKVGFNVDHDHVVSDEVRFVQMTPPGSACSIAFGKGLTDAEPGSVKGLQVVVSDIQEAHDHLQSVGIDPGEIDIQPWGHFVGFSDPDGNQWAVQYMPYRNA